MLSYIASNSTANLINAVCKEDSITILNQEVEEIDFLKYIKQTKVNFNLIKYLIIDLSQLKNTDDEVINSIKYFKEMYVNTRIIIIAKGYDDQNVILTNLYENSIYNIINALDEIQVKEEIRKCLSQNGLQEKNARRFKKIEIEKIDKKFKYHDFILKLKGKFKSREKPNKNTETQNQINSSVYFFAVLIDAIKSLVRLLCYIAVFILTSIGLTFLFNEELRNMIFQIFNH
ncbi:MAG: hypothetical protein HFJ57_00455 [Clostridia bacterium]|nr:hypothetical protein [Clostridia bacterium]